ncbi:MAG: dihydropteroate synthase [Turneriella sp.]
MHRENPGLPVLWAIINLTPDSFYAASRATVAEAVGRAEKMFADGAAVIDVGAESTRPGASPVSAEVQAELLVSFLNSYRSHFGDAFMRRISIDTRDLTVMQRVAEFSVGYINDVSGGSPEIYRFIASAGLEYVLMHTQGDPQNMQKSPAYTDVCTEVLAYLRERTEYLTSAGVNRDKIIWDTGIGFGKTVEHNLQLIAAQPRFRESGHRILAGVSRKSFIGRILGQHDPSDRLVGTLATQIYLTLRGLEILRVHDVREMADALRMIAAIQEHEL